MGPGRFHIGQRRMWFDEYTQPTPAALARALALALARVNRWCLPATRQETAASRSGE